MHDEPIMDVAHLAHLEVLTPKPEESLRFFVDVLGMTESGRRGESVYLRAWDDYERYSLKLTGSNTSGLAHAAFRARSPQALQRRVQALQGSGYEVGWHEGELSHGPAYRFHDPDGHLIELYYETEWYEAPAALRPALKNQAQRFPARGVNVRRLDHFNCLAVDVQANREFFERYLGFRSPSGSFSTMARKPACGSPAPQELRLRLYARGSRRGAASIISPMRWTAARTFFARPTSSSRTASSSRPGRTSTRCSRLFPLCLRAGRQPLEVANAGARLVLAPDWKPIVWTEEERKKGQAWGLKTIESFHTHGTPPLPGPHGSGAASDSDDLSEKGIAS